MTETCSMSLQQNLKYSYLLSIFNIDAMLVNFQSFANVSNVLWIIPIINILSSLKAVLHL